MNCPYCNNEKTRVIDTNHDARGGTRRRRVCDNCQQRFSSYERPILATPLVVKKDGTREEFSREKMLAGVRVACAKRPVAAEDIERIAGEVEAELQQMGRAEVNSRWSATKSSKSSKNSTKSPIFVTPSFIWVLMTWNPFAPKSTAFYWANNSRHQAVASREGIILLVFCLQLPIFLLEGAIYDSKRNLNYPCRRYP
jgi:transcriptional repressor NrdR